MANRKIIVFGNKSREKYPTNNNVVFNNNTLFSINDITVSTKIVPRNVINYKDKYKFNKTTLTLNSMNIDTIESSKKYTSFINRVVMSFDRKNLNNYAYFGSLYDLMISTVSDIINKWRGSLYVEFFKDGNIYQTATNYVYNKATNRSTFTINSFLISNKFELNYVNKKNIDTLFNDIKDLNTYYKNYEIWYVDDNGEEQKFPIIGFTGSTEVNSGNITIIAQGECFPNSPTIIKAYHIKPLESEYLKFYSDLNTLQKYLLNKESTPKFTSTFKVLERDLDDNIIFKDIDLTWGTSDGYNIDIDTIQYGEYFKKLLNIAKSYDDYKSDLIVRFLTPSSLINFDNTDDGKMKKLLRTYGRELDEIKSFIDGITYVSKISYDKIENIPDLLIKNLAKNLGWEPFPIVDEEDIIDSFFSYEKSKELGFYDTPYEIDIELWRRIIINTNWFFKAKGTRRAIETIFAFIGAPECLVEFNEHIYLAENKINVNSISDAVVGKIETYNPNFTRFPYDNEGYPKAPNETVNFHFQISGNTDRGQHYINLYRDIWNPQNLEIEKVVDNRKSWFYTGQTKRLDTLRETSYEQNDSRLIINTKEVNVTLDIAKAIECDVYNFNYEYNYPVSSTGRTFPYPQDDRTKIDVSKLTFAEYIQKIYSTFIDVKNRKIITDNRGGGYPTLTKLYIDYLNNSLNDIGFQSKRRTLKFMLNYINKFDKVWPKFVDQLIPATTIFEGGGEKYRNTIFTPQKFVYQSGIDTGSEFAKKQKGTLEDQIQILKVESNVTIPSYGDLNIYSSVASYQYSPDSIFRGENQRITNLKQLVDVKSIQKWNYNLYDFVNPNYNVSGACKMVNSSFTNSAIYYYDEQSSKNLDFIIYSASTVEYGTGSTKTYFTLNDYNYINNEFNKEIIYDKYLTSYTYSGSSIIYTDSVLKTFLTRDTEYLVKVYFEKTFTGDTFNGDVSFYTSANTPYSLYENFDFVLYPQQYETYFDVTKYKDYTNNIAFLNTKFNYDIVDDLPFKYYQQEKDFYFVSVGSPTIPFSLIQNNIITIDNTNLQFITENIPVTSGMTSFITTYNPIGDIQLSLRGLVRIPNQEYFIDGTFLTNERRRYILSETLIDEEDVITISYITNGTGSDVTYDCETYTISAITSATTRPMGEKFFYNSATTKYEYYIESGITSVNNINLSIRGQVLANGLDFTLSNLDNTKIILNVSDLYSGDTINVCYITKIVSEIVYDLDTNPYNFSWSINTPIPTNELGYFYQEFTDVNDFNFSSVIYSSVTNYIDGSSLFNVPIDFNDTPLILGTTYRYRIVSNRQFTTLMGNTINVKAYSNNFIIRLPN